MIREVAMTTALVLGFLVVMLLGGRLIRYFGMAAEGGLDVGVLFTLIGYNLPYFLELIFPLSFFIGLMLVFGRLYADHEMVVLNASGISRGRVSRLIIPLVLVAFLAQGFITLVAKPWGVAKAANIWQEQSVLKIFDIITPRKFISSGEYHLYVGEIGENREYLQDVIVIQMAKNPDLRNAASMSDIAHQDDQADNAQKAQEIATRIPQELISEKDTIIFAKSATQVDSDDGVIRLDLHQGRRYEVDATSKKYSQIGFERYRISLAASSNEDLKPLKIEGWRTQDLFANMNTPNQTPSSQEIHAELGYRFSLPWLILIAAILAAPLAQVKPRQGRWLKLIPALFIFVANVLILISLKESIAKGKVGDWAYPVVLAVLFAVAIYINYHERMMAKLRLNRQGGAA
ncbi:ABC transporter permease [Moraxella bovoculi]|uniref:ABC transporter permease n=1 Tax=Moraxella bovoculi TaxID=386891 RepID=A0AAC8PU14_9GAMM|nr:LPS export ABC transporter permease LptF [Moraxella bovoculi]AKG06883.1 ABC transporter permease [Moraxella bovoculi]AKG08872.1 ABC transporter permease [Moraxella bovoculi]AKG10703.1 ABC transporter permease [Moraxella bovoculi]AKG12742.1 ABC transporter permease [Moraxella bovoculi]